MSECMGRAAGEIGTAIGIIAHSTCNQFKGEGRETCSDIGQLLAMAH